MRAPLSPQMRGIQVTGLVSCTLIFQMFVSSAAPFMPSSWRAVLSAALSSLVAAARGRRATRDAASVRKGSTTGWFSRTAPQRFLPAFQSTIGPLIGCDWRAVVKLTAAGAWHPGNRSDAGSARLESHAPARLGPGDLLPGELHHDCCTGERAQQTQVHLKVKVVYVWAWPDFAEARL